MQQGRQQALPVLLLLCYLITHSVAVHPNVNNCTKHYMTQFVDHFGFSTPTTGGTYQQLYYTYDNYWGGAGYPIFFYTGNEGPVELYANVTGLMWENAPTFKALIVFAEHRYYGDSLPCGKLSWIKCPQYLTHEQALADYAYLIDYLKAQNKAETSPVITFGGSYGGMLTAWFRMKYPETSAGGISASAPILGFRFGMTPVYEPSSYWKVVTDTARYHYPSCVTNVNKAVQEVFTLGYSGQQGREQLRDLLGLCVVPTPEHVEWVNYLIQLSFDNLAMGDYPYPIRYIFGDAHHLPPAFPMKVACSHLTGDLSGTELLRQMKQALQVPLNFSRSVPCFIAPPPTDAAGEWDYQYCTELLPQEVPYFEAKGLPNDMFWKQTAWNISRITDHCMKKFSLKPRYGWIGTEYGGHNMEYVSNLVFSNGLLDPWHSGGVTFNSTTNKDFTSYLIEGGAHHLDLFFSNPADPPSVKWVRRRELEHISKWLKEHYEKKEGKVEISFNSSNTLWAWKQFVAAL